MRERDRQRGIAAHTVRIPIDYRRALTILARIFRDGSPADQRRALVTIANLEQKILRAGVSSALEHGLEDPVQKAYASTTPDRRCRESEALLDALVQRMTRSQSDGPGSKRATIIRLGLDD